LAGNAKRKVPSGTPNHIGIGIIQTDDLPQSPTNLCSFFFSQNPNPNNAMKLSIATTLLSLATTTAFAPTSSVSSGSALRSTVTSDVYTFTKSNEIFEEAKTVRVWLLCF
jgi:hypothetical protein